MTSAPTGPDAVRVGVIGTGAMGAAHVDNLAHRVPGATVTQVFDVEPGRAQEVAGSVGAHAASSAESLIVAADVDAVVIAAPDPLHEPLALACLARGLPTLLEKPIASTVEGGRRLVDAELAAGRRLLRLGFMRRYDAAYVALRELVLGGSIGRVKAAHCRHRNAHQHPTHTDESVLFGSMIHELDCVPWLLGDPLAAVTVFAAGATDGGLKDLQVAVVETEGGAVVTIEVFVNAAYGYDIHTEVVGTAGTVSLTPPYGVSVRRVLPAPPARSGVDGRVVGEDATERFRDAYRVEVGSWIDDVRAGRHTGPTAWDGYRANVAAFAAIRSQRHGARVEIPRDPRPDLYG